MMRFLYILFSLCLLLFGMACNDSIRNGNRIVEDGKIDFIIVQINDVYEIGSLGGGKLGGMARVHALRKELLRENPNTLLVHAGDFLSPSLVGTLKLEGKRVKGRQMIEMMNMMDFDLVALGNHEFDLKYMELQERFNESNFPWISTNNKLVRGDSLVPFFIEKEGVKTDIPRHVVKTIRDEDGTELRLGFISATLPSNPKDYVDYGDFYEAAKLAFRQVRAASDLVLGLTHLELSQDKLLAATLPKIPLLMGGHEHENKNVRVGEARITKADANAKSAYIHRISYDVGTGEYDIQSDLKIIDERIEEDSEALKVVDKWNAIQLERLRDVVDDPEEIIFTSTDTLDGRDIPVRSRQTNLGQYIAEAMYEAYADQVDGAFVNGGSIRIDDQLVGDISGVDVFRVLPFGGGVLKIKIKGVHLEKVLQYGYLSAGTGAYLQRHLIEKHGEVWNVAGLPIVKEKIYTIAISDYLIRGLDIPMLKEEHKDVLEVYRPSEGELGHDIRKAVIELLKSKNK